MSEPPFDRMRAEMERIIDAVDEEELAKADPPWVGGVVPLELLMARSEDGAVVLRSIVAFPDGFELCLQLSTPQRGFRDRDFCFGVIFPDGTRLTEAKPCAHPDADGSDWACGMYSQSGGGSPLNYVKEWWIWPLPGDGTIRFTCEWPSARIPRTHVSLDAGVISRAALQAEPVWSDDLARESHGSLRRAAAHFRRLTSDG